MTMTTRMVRMSRGPIFLALVVLIAPRCASGFFCKYPTQRLTGLADIREGGGAVKLDITVHLIGPECDVVITGGRLRCSRVGFRTLGVRFTPPARGRCPAAGARIVGGSYVPRSADAEPTIADVTIDAELENGGACIISGVSPWSTFGGVFSGPLASLFGHMTC